MKMQLSKDSSNIVLVESVIAFGLVAIGYATGQGFLVTVASTTVGIGGSLVANTVEKKIQGWMTSWVDKNGVLNNDISWALEKSLLATIDLIETEWKSSYHYHYLFRSNRESAQVTLEPLNLFRQNITKLFTPFENYEQFIKRQNFVEYLHTPQSEFQGKWNDAIKNYFWGHDDQLVTLFKSKFESYWYQSFVKLLASNGEKESRVRRSLLYLWQSSLTESIGAIHGEIFEVDNKISWLQDWARTFQSSILQEIKQSKPQFYETLSSKNPPRAPGINHNFFGHISLRRKLLARIGSQDSQSSQLALWGLPGSGKTTLALWLANDKTIEKKYTDGILWASLGKTPSIMEITYKWLLSLGVDHASLNDDTPESRIYKLTNLLQNRKCLVIFDDVWAANYVGEIISALGENCFLILTARSYDLLSGIVNPDNIIKINPLPDKSALNLLIDVIGKNTYSKYIQQDSDTKSAQLQKIIRYFGNLPLAIRLIGPSLRQRILVGLDIEEFVQRMFYKAQEIYLLNKSISDQKNDISRLYVSIGMSYEFLSDDETRQALLKLISFGSQPLDFDWNALKNIWLDTPEKMENWLINLVDTCLIETVTLHSGEARMTSKGLRTFETAQLETRYSIHPMIYLFIQQEITRTGISTIEFYRSYAEHYLHVYKSYCIQFQKENSGRSIDLCTLSWAEHGDWPHIRIAQKWTLENWQFDNKTAKLCIEYAKLVGDRTLGCAFCFIGSPDFTESWRSLVEAAIPISIKIGDEESKIILERKLKKLHALLWKGHK